MILTEASVLGAAMAAGWLDPAQAVDGNLRVVQGDRRHRHFRIEVCEPPSRGPGLFVKQVREWNAETTTALQREAACYARIAGDDAFAPLRAWTPTLRGYDPTRQILAVELYQDAPNMTQFHAPRMRTAAEIAQPSAPGGVAAGDDPDAARAPVWIAEALGAALGRSHRARGGAADAGAASPLGPLFPGRTPWILTLHRTPVQMHPQGAGASFVANTLRQDPALRQTMEQLAQGYDRRPRALIHGDIKWDNVLVLAEERAIRVIDWEIADWGDPLWDVAGALQSYLVFWLLSMPLTAAVAPAQMEARAGFPLADVQPALRALWTAYADARGFDPDAAVKALRLTMRYTAARIVQTTYESGVAYGQPLPQLRFMLQLAQNALLRPDGAVVDLLGIAS